MRDAFCRKVVEKLSEQEETFDDMVEYSCRVGNVARKCVTDQPERTMDDLKGGNGTLKLKKQSNKIVIEALEVLY